jgi:hypothetical protein
MKALFVFAALFLSAAVLKSEEIFFPTKVGTILVYKTFDKKDKETSTLKYTIKNSKISGNDMDITYQCESYDAKQKLIYKEDITIHKKGDKLYFDMSNFINKAALQKNGEISPEIIITGNNMEMPSNPKEGDLLPDANVTMAMSMGFMTMKMSATVANRKVEAIENITVKGGTFKCYKFSSDVTSTVMGLKMSSKNMEWYSKGIGVVRSESYDKNGKLQSHMELIEVQK